MACGLILHTSFIYDNFRNLFPLGGVSHMVPLCLGSRPIDSKDQLFHRIGKLDRNSIIFVISRSRT